MAEVPTELLGPRWVHSHEDDTDTQMVFRPDTFSFPPSRGRVSFELRDDGTFTDRGIGPTDRPEDVAGTWDVDESGRIVLRDRTTNEVRRTLEIESVSEDRLVVRK